MSAASTISQAVTVALQPNSTTQQRQEAYTYLEQVKANAASSYQDCFQLFLANEQYAPDARLYALQVLDEAIGNGTGSLDENALAALKEGLLTFIAKEYVDGQAEGSHTYLRNKLAQTLFFIFLQTYTSSWPDFFSVLIQWTTSLPSSQAGTGLNAQTTDLLLRVLHEISVELSDTALRLNKPYGRLTKDAEFRDTIRSRDAPQIATSVFRILSESLQGMQEAPSTSRFAVSGKTAEELTRSAVQVIGDYVSWIDINLIVSDTTVPLFFQCLQMPQAPIRLAALDALIETIGKGMPAPDKIQLVRILNLVAVITQMLEMSNATKAKGELSDEEREVREKLARMLNALGVELVKIAEDTAGTAQVRSQARELVFQLLPALLQNLADDNADVSVSVLTFASSLLSLFKKEKKREPQTHLTPEKQAFLTELLQTVLTKMSYGEDDDWLIGSDEDDEEEVKRFSEMRKNLKVLSHAVAWITDSTYITCAQSLVGSVLDTIDAGGAAALKWQQVELALHVLYDLGEAIKFGPGLAAFVQVPNAERNRAKKEDAKIDYHAFPLSPLGELLLRTVRSRVTTYPHPCAPLNFFESVNRYSELFVLWPQEVPKVLEPLLDTRGIHQPSKAVQARSFYLFHRFIIQNKDRLKDLPPEAVHSIMNALQPLLVIKAEIKEGDTDGDPLEKAAHASSAFHAQLFLFEAVGNLSHSLMHRSDAQQSLLQSTVGPLLEALRSSVVTVVASPQNLVAILQVHHCMLAISCIAKGFPHASQPPKSQGPWIEIFQVAAQTITESIKVMGSVAIIREAALSAFKVIVPILGPVVFPIIPSFIEDIVGHLSSADFTEFLPFLSLLLVKYKDDFAPLLDAMLTQILSRLFVTLQQPALGTDDELRQSDLRRAYFSLLMSTFSNNYQSILLSHHNQNNFSTLLDSVVHYTTVQGNLLDQRAGYSLLTRMVLVWMPPETQTNGQTTGAPSADGTIPGFEQFCYQQPLKSCFEIPMRDGFDYGDAQSYNVLGEISIFLKAIHQKRKTEFEQLLLGSTFPELGLSSARAQDFVAALGSAQDGKVFKKYFAPLIQTLKREKSSLEANSK